MKNFINRALVAKKHLKLFFALFAMLALGVGNAWGAETVETISYSNHKGKGTSSTGSAHTMNGDKFSITDSKFYCDATKTYAQFYANSTITITPNTGVTIKNIVITASSSSYNGFQSSGTFTPSIGSVTKTDNTHITWAGSATSEFTISHTKQIRWTAIEVTYEETTSGGGENPGEGGGEEPTPDPEEPETGGETWTLVTNASDLKAGDIIVIASNTKGFVASSTITSGYMGQVNSTFSTDKSTITTLPAEAAQLTIGGTSGAWTLTYDGKQLGATAVKKVAWDNGTKTWSITIANDGGATIQNGTSTYGRFLHNVSSTRFTTYTSNATSSMLLPQIYKKVTSSGETPETPTPSVSVSPASHTFATTNVGETATQEFTITAENTTATLSASIDNTTDFAISAITGDKVTVTYQPQSAGDLTATMTVKAGEEASTTVALTGKAKTPLAPIAGGVIDILNQAWTGKTNSTYGDVAAKTAENEGHSNAQYVAQCAGDKSSIQLRSNNNNSGVVSTISGGIVKRVEVEWQNETAAGRVLQVYGSNTAYEAATDLYSDDKKGELLGEITMGGDETVVDYSQWTGDYKYIGLRSKSGAMYLTTITITWLPINSKVTIDDAIQNGSISVSGVADLNAVAAGTMLTLDNTSDAGYKFVKYNVYKTGEPTTEIDVENSKFTMPEYDVTVSATFTSIKELDKIEVNTTNVKKTFWQGEAFNSNGLEVTAYYTDGTSAEVTPTNITGGNTENAGEITVTVSYTEGSNTKTTTYNIIVKAIENNETTVYTVAQAREIIDAVGNTTVEVYVQGIVSKIVTAFNPTYGNISYDISADGSKTSDQLQAYRGFSYNGDWFTSVDDIQVGDVVVVKGKLKIYNTTYELDEGNQLVKLERSDEPKPTAASLPFEFDGNKDDIADVVGMSQTGLGSYSSSPKLKFDDENDNVIIHFDSEPGEFSFALKQNGSNAGTFTVYESANGEDYTSVWSGGNLGNGQTSTIESNLSSTARYVKFELTTKGSSTNYGLGQISIKKIDKRQESGLAWNPATVSLTVGDAFTAPTFSNPNVLAGITFTSDNEALATVNNAGVISLVSGKTGKATITATFADGDATYKPAEVTCVITVNPKSETVVILAQLEGQWYAMTGAYVSGKTNVLAAIPVEYINGTLYNVAEADKASIEWQRSMNGNKATFKNGDNYLTGGTSGTDLTLKTIEFEWDYNGVNYLSGNATTKRTFLYCVNTQTAISGFKNYAISNAGSVKNNSDGTTESYSSTPEVVAPVYATATIYTRSVTSGNFGTICLPYGSSNYSGAEFFEVAGKETGKVTLNSVKTLVAGTPYIFQATNSKISVVYEGEAAETALVDNGLHGTFEKIDDVKTTSAGKGYIIALMTDGTCALQLCGENCWLDPYRAYLVIEKINKTKSPMPGCRRISMNVQGENVETGVEDIFSTNAPIKVIENGQLIIIRDGIKYNIQGQRL